MNWCSIRHKWVYKKENIIYEKISSGYSKVIFPELNPISTEVRLCKRCHKKERMGISGYWIEWDLTKEEERDIKLKELGI